MWSNKTNKHTDYKTIFLQEGEDNDSGSETGSESMFETAPITQELDEPTLKLPVDTDYQSDASSDILQPTQVRLRPKWFICVVPVSLSTLIFSPNPKH